MKMDKAELPAEGEEQYRKLEEYADLRRSELTERLSPVVELADAYGILVSRAVIALGDVPPASRQETVLRDLIADVFDFLYEWPRPLFEGRLQVAFPLGRRAYESLSLLSACNQDLAIAERWDSGKQISNGEIRKALAELPFSESEELLGSLYRFFSKGAHPNRDLISERYLGEENSYVLGSIGQPPLVLIVDQCQYLVQMWFWFGAVVGHVARHALANSDPTWGQDYLKVAENAKTLAQWLGGSFNALLAEAQDGGK